MVDRFVGRQLKRRSHALALSIAASSWLAACEDSTKSEPDEREQENVDRDEEGDKGERQLDASAPKKDSAQPPAQSEQDASAPSKGPTVSADLWCKAKAVLDDRCAACHDGKGTGPMPLLTVEDFAADAVASKGKVYAAVAARIHDEADPMPPRDTLTADELAALDALVAAKPSGETPSCGTTDKKPQAAWPPAGCDAVYKLVSHGTDAKDPYVVPVGQEIHPQVYYDTPWGDEDVQAIAYHPITDNEKVLHHWILYSAQGAFLHGWAPGDESVTAYPSDIGMNMPKGKRGLRLDMHYFNTKGTQEELDMSGVEVCVVKGANKRPKAAAVMTGFTSLGPVLAPAGAKDRPVTGTCNVTTTTPVHLLTSSPHAHTLANHMRFTVQKKDGTEILLHDGPFKFTEQVSYPVQPEVILETGDKVLTTCYYTNESSRNVTFGESTTNEMCFNFASYWPAGALRCSNFGGFDLSNLGDLLGN